MTTSSYAVSVIPAAQKSAFNLICAMVYGDPLSAQNLSRPLIPAAGSDVAAPSHWFGGRPVDSAWAVTFGPGAPLPIPATGWPLVDGEAVLLTEADATTAWAARYININTGESVESLPAQNVAAVLVALALKEPPEEF